MIPTLSGFIWIQLMLRTSKSFIWAIASSKFLKKRNSSSYHIYLQSSVFSLLYFNLRFLWSFTFIYLHAWVHQMFINKTTSVGGGVRLACTEDLLNCLSSTAFLFQNQTYHTVPLHKMSTQKRDEMSTQKRNIKN